MIRIFRMRGSRAFLGWNTVNHRRSFPTRAFSRSISGNRCRWIRRMASEAFSPPLFLLPFLHILFQPRPISPLIFLFFFSSFSFFFNARQSIISTRFEKIWEKSREDTQILNFDFDPLKWFFWELFLLINFIEIVRHFDMFSR